ncbi:oxidoreductase [Mycobacterium tuberculosis variant africanum]|nr:oxidoreductase [Mycobacterium tuberculosis variant africanum]
MRPPISPQLLINRPAMQPVDLTGKRILLTGASSGIGAAATKQFGLHRAVVVAVARRKDLLDAVADRITGDGGTAMSLPCDLSDMEAIDALVEDVEKRIGGIDILINNAGRSIRRPLAESLERWHDVERTMVLNYYARCGLSAACTRDARAWRRPYHQCRHLGRVVGGFAAVLGVQRIEGRTVGGEPDHRNRVG